MLDATTFVPPATRPSAATPRPRGLAGLRRSAKLGAALVLFGAACYALISAFGSVVSDNAVVSAYTVSVRTPIAGYVSGLHAKVGTPISTEAILAWVDEPRIDDQRRIDLINQLQHDRAELSAWEQERNQLTQQRTALLDRAAERNRSEVLYLNLQAAEAERQVRLREAARDYANRDRDRTEALGRTGNAAPAQVDKVRALADQADRDAEAALFRLAYLRVQAEAAGRGLLLENGSNDVPYSSQRADEIAVRLAEIERQIAALSTAGQETATRLDAEQNRIALLRHADLNAPSSGILWKLGASEGEHLGANDVVAQLVNCDSVFVLAAIAQDRVPDVAVGGLARIRLSGENADRTGRVISVTGESNLNNDRNLAAAPVPQRSASAMARIELPVDGGNTRCLVGRTARVLLPTTADSGFLSVLIRRFF